MHLLLHLLLHLPFRTASPVPAFFTFAFLVLASLVFAFLVFAFLYLLFLYLLFFLSFPSGESASRLIHHAERIESRTCFSPQQLPYEHIASGQSRLSQTSYTDSIVSRLNQASPNNLIRTHG